MALVLVLFQHQFFIMCCCEGVNEHENLNPSRGKYNGEGDKQRVALLAAQVGGCACVRKSCAPPPPTAMDGGFWFVCIAACIYIYQNIE